MKAGGALNKQLLEIQRLMKDVELLSDASTKERLLLVDGFRNQVMLAMAIECPVYPFQLGMLINRIADGVISNNAAKQVFHDLWQGKSDVDAIIEAKGLKQMNDTGELEKIIDDVLAANPKNVEEFKAGNAKALNGLVGPIMKASKGKANPAQVNALLMKKLG
jgi:Asp-tRNA(Asn)/Glu-tRNA(Gln) amidotransferase B subunit